MKTKLFIFFLLPLFVFGQAQIGDVINGETTSGQTGFSVSLSADGSTLAVGTPFPHNNEKETIRPGHVRVYKKTGEGWVQIGNTIEPEITSSGNDNNSWFGYSVSLSADGNVLAVGAPQGGWVWRGSVRVYAYSGGQWTRIGGTIDGTRDDGYIGWSVSLSADGGTVAIGAPRNGENGNNSGRVEVYKNNAGNWTLVGDAINGSEESYSGWSVFLSADGSTLAVGALVDSTNGENSGQVRVYKISGGNWTQVGDAINGTVVGGQTGQSISLSANGSVLAVGSPISDSGQVRVYKNSGGNWTQIGDAINGVASGDRNGLSVSLSADGNTLAIGAPRSDINGTDSGQARVYKKIAENWILKGVFNGSFDNELSGLSVSLSADGSTLAVGAPRNSTLGKEMGQVRVYKSESCIQCENWTQSANINGSAAGDQNGNSVSFSADGSTLVVGAPYNDLNGTDSGQVLVYKKNAGVWVQTGLGISGVVAGDHNGHSVSLSADGSILAIGAPDNNANGTNSGMVRVFRSMGGNWMQAGNPIYGIASGDRNGYCVSLSADGRILAVGAPYNGTNGRNSGQVRIYKRDEGNNWKQTGVVNGMQPSALSGYSISLSADGSILAIGAPSETFGLLGVVRVYKNSGGSWTQSGGIIQGTMFNDYTGYSVSLSADGSILAVGSPDNNGNGLSQSGLVRVFKNNGTEWIPIGTGIGGTGAQDRNGRSVSLSADGSILAIGAPFNTVKGDYSGQVRVFRNKENNWTQVGRGIDAVAAYDSNGYGVSLSGDGSAVAIGAPGNDAGGIDSGLARVFIKTIATGIGKKTSFSEAVINKESSIVTSVVIYPNPASGQVTIGLEEGATLKEVNIYDATGRFIKTEKQEKVDISTLSEGNYFFEIITDKGKTTKIVVKK